MKIKKIKVENFRLLKDFTLDLEDNLSLILGKNNTGKTSLLSVLEKFLTDKSDFSINDFNLIELNKLKKFEVKKGIEIPEDFDLKIRLLFEIHYDISDSLKNISELILNLEDDNKVVLGFEYRLNSTLYGILDLDYKKYKFENPKKTIIDFLKLASSKRFFKLEIKSFEPKKNFKELDSFEIIKDKTLVSRIINFQSIKAKREVNNSDTNRPDKTLSKLSSEYYESLENTDQEEETIKKLKKELELTDEKLNKIYPIVFKDVIKKVELFGGKIKGESLIGIISTLESKNILKENTSVFYKYLEHHLPEDYHGLGYMNLFAMIFEIELKCRNFRKENEKIEKQYPADINLLFIEEPEAHTHPQMQHIFIKNVTKILYHESNAFDSEGNKEDSKKTFNLQGIITTHSSHITAESDFDTVKYFYKSIKDNTVNCKNLRDLGQDYSLNTEQYNFLKHYLTLNKAELFFADKAVLVEGDTERLLLPVMMSKLDINEKLDLPLLSQNISIIEVGAYSHIFENFLDFIGIKYLLVTDFDSYLEVDSGEKNKEGEVILKKQLCRAEDESACGTFNEAIKYFLKDKTFMDLRASTSNFIIKEGNFCIAFQHKENSYHAKSFEDAFISINLDFIKQNKDNFKGLKNKKYFDLTDDKIKDSYDLANECIMKKTHFALDIIYNSNKDYTNWDIPSYIKEGLLWLQK